MNKNRLATFEVQGVPNDFAGTGEGWTAISPSPRRYVSVAPLTGRELIIAQQNQSQANCKIKVDWFEGLTTAHRCKIEKYTRVNDDDSDDDNYRIFHFESVQNVGEMNKEYEIMAVERV